MIQENSASTLLDSNGRHLLLYSKHSEKMAEEATGKTEQIRFNSEMIDHFLLSPFHFFYIFCVKKVVILCNV